MEEIMKKNKLEEVNVMEGINFKKAQARQAKLEKTRRIKEQEFARKQKIRKIALTVEVIIISAVIYVLTGILGELAQDNTFYRVMCYLSWIWLFFGQFGAFFAIWCDDNEK
jgi:cytochrome c-type biogenesis protein CcmH/NrfG